MSGENIVTHMETENEHIEVYCIAPEGLGFGKGSIGIKRRLLDLNDGLTPETITKITELITGPDILIEVDVDPNTGQRLEDDGCGDGREVSRVIVDGQEKSRSLVRAKVMGGGAGHDGCCACRNRRYWRNWTAGTFS